jgi:protein-tyrosine phosphatase
MARTIYNDRAHEILPRLFLSGMPGAQWDLATHDISLVVSLSANLPPQAGDKMGLGEAQGRGQVVYLHWPIEDGNLPDLPTAALVVEVIRSALVQGRGVLVHCAAGSNRSALVVALVVREIQRVDGRTAAALVMETRPGTLRNRDFLVYLESLGAPGA